MSENNKDQQHHHRNRPLDPSNPMAKENPEQADYTEAPHQHPGIAMGIDYIYGSDQDQYMNNEESEE